MPNESIELEFFGSIIHQRIHDKMICVTDLSVIYDNMREDCNWPEKQLHRFFDKDKSENYEFIIELIKEGNLINCDISKFTDIVERDGLISALKRFELYIMTGTGSDRVVYCHLYIFIAIAMWLNPTFKARVTIWITDQVMFNKFENREPNRLEESISRHIAPKNSSKEDKKVVYTDYLKLIANHILVQDDFKRLASKDDLKAITRLQDKLSTLIEVGYISTYQEAKTYISTI